MHADRSKSTNENHPVYAEVPCSSLGLDDMGIADATLIHDTRRMMTGQ